MKTRTVDPERRRMSYFSSVMNDPPPPYSAVPAVSSTRGGDIAVSGVPVATQHESRDGARRRDPVAPPSTPSPLSFNLSVRHGSQRSDGTTAIPPVPSTPTFSSRFGPPPTRNGWNTDRTTARAGIVVTVNARRSCRRGERTATATPWSPAATYSSRFGPPPRRGFRRDDGTIATTPAAKYSSIFGPPPTRSGNAAPATARASVDATSRVKHGRCGRRAASTKPINTGVYATSGRVFEKIARRCGGGRHGDLTVQPVLSAAADSVRAAARTVQATARTVHATAPPLSFDPSPKATTKATLCDPLRPSAEMIIDLKPIDEWGLPSDFPSDLDVPPPPYNAAQDLSGTSPRADIPVCSGTLVRCLRWCRPQAGSCARRRDSAPATSVPLSSITSGGCPRGNGTIGTTPLSPPATTYPSPFELDTPTTGVNVTSRVKIDGCGRSRSVDGRRRSSPIWTLWTSTREAGTPSRLHAAAAEHHAGVH
ncbi:hypothetical protein FA95DRAFT_1606455 [Auriscalpium vulgare]|uniref:Uncharacterized protein n=1 Tax=Auriscalpium vulgare TaxID=40419 RepID=A0ACB8RSQ3_9AGAM|nr:hypothetical protein FA95DRAFT_1606455 [Auriscalpium vulgare]